MIMSIKITTSFIDLSYVVFYRETKGSRGREWANDRKAHHALGGEEVGGPSSPLLR